ncbi:helix-turn-helix domain-containing protein [Monoglobus pectinilyticus]|uniref:helix-turn-helix domain-containing protein n=1 Tax=Monoglobus pectinilyticus TaxID=1981510 RepID=UPI0027BA3932|nr:helix-turn-helix transcriptional regulator [Monoglobus pectinilyticus]
MNLNSLKFTNCGHTKYWLYKQLGMSYQNFSKMVNNETKSIKYSNIDAMCQILKCKPSDLFEYNPNIPMNKN